MSQPIIGFIGFGEAAYLISEGLKSEGVTDIYAFDVNTNHPTLGSVILKRANKLQVHLTTTINGIFEKCQYIFCATSAKVAESIAKEVKHFIKENQYYIDLNAASPMVKEKIADYISESGAKFVDAAVMDSVPLKRHKVPIFLSGTGAEDFENIGNQMGMNLTFINEKPGASSAIKMFRSIFMKGFSALLIETLQSSKKYGVSKLVMESLDESITSRSLEETANLLLPRTAIHAERRVAEMDEVIKTLQVLDIDSTISEAIKKKLKLLVDLKVKELLNNKVPDHYDELLLIIDENK